MTRPAKVLLGALALLALATPAAHSKSASANPAAAPAVPVEIAEHVFEAKTGFGPDWEDYGWAPRKLKVGAPAVIDFAQEAGWLIAHPELQPRFGALVVRFRAPAGHGIFLEARLDSTRNERFDPVRLDAAHLRALGGGLSEATVPLSELDPQGAIFDRILLRAYRSVPSAPVFIESIWLTKGSGPRGVVEELPAPATIAVDCRAPGRAISPLIYGIAYDARKDASEGWLWELNPGARRWGGNATTRYNWELGNAWNTASDWYFQNVNFTDNPSFSWRDFLDADLAHHVKTALTVPIIGWVAKDTSSYSFPVAKLGAQRGTAPEQDDAGDGFSAGGKPLTPLAPSRTSVAAPPSFVERWIAAITDRDRGHQRSVDLVFLDNEPTLWDSTHRDVHPGPVTYDELLARTLTYAAAVRKADPKATIAGLSAWGWPALFYSGLDARLGLRLHPDRRAHGNKEFVPWWLQKVHAEEQRTGVKLVDALDVHFYPQGQDLGIGLTGATDAETAARRIRSTRALWDPAYRDESWIDEPIRLIPRLRDWIAADDPGLGITIGEWNFGAEQHMSGGLAVAEALGHFGVEGVSAAFYWTYPVRNSEAWWAFRAFRNYDGKGARFLDREVPASTAATLLSAFASRDETGSKLVLVLLNEDPARPLDVSVDLASCGAVSGGRAFTHVAGERGFAEAQLDSKGQSALPRRLAPYSISVLELELAKKP